MSEPRFRLAPASNARVYCKQCGALVVDTVLHTNWHATLDAATAGDLR